MPKASFDEVWQRVIGNEGEEFHTITGLEFTYEVGGDFIVTSRARQNISKSDFMKALGRVPLQGPSEINDIVRGPAYVWAILHDSRISRGEW